MTRDSMTVQILKLYFHTRVSSKLLLICYIGNNLDEMNQVTFNNLTKADGSALVNHEETIVQASVFGPSDIAQSKAIPDEALIDILFHPKINIPSASPAFDKIREIENILRNIFREVILVRYHPKTYINVMIQEIHDSGCLLIATINATCCALLDAAIPMRCPVTAVRIKQQQTESGPQRVFDFVFDGQLNIISLMTKGKIDELSLDLALREAMKVGKQQLDRLREKVCQRFAIGESVD